MQDIVTVALYALFFASAAASATAYPNVTHCIVIDQKRGNDSLCLQSNATSPCKTIRYVFNNAFLTNKEIVLRGDHQINQTLRISHVNNFTIRGNNSIIQCSLPISPSDEGSGLIYEYVSNLKVFSVTFEGCGTLQYSTLVRNYVNIKYRSAVYVINSSDIYLIETNFVQSVGRGLSLYNVKGLVEIRKSIFFENMVPVTERNERFGGGGILIEFTHCFPGFPLCSPEIVHNSRYIIADCLFEGNKVSNNEVIDQSYGFQFKISPGSDGDTGDHGGAINILYKGATFNNSINITSCRFLKNFATYGGSINSILSNMNHNNSIFVNDCYFGNNHALQGGGGVNMGYYDLFLREISYNSIIFSNSIFKNNTAKWGGAVVIFSTRTKFDAHNEFHFSECSWISNTASIAAAVGLFPSIWDTVFYGTIPSVSFKQCSFLNNVIKDDASFLKISAEDTSQHALESGILDVHSFPVDFFDNVSFSGNRGSAIRAEAAQINVLEDSVVYFENNSATKGGAIALLGFSFLELYPGSQVIFHSNYASELGGAVYTTSPYQAEFLFSHKCFISYYNGLFSDPEGWNTMVNFTNNTSEYYGHSIYADSLIPCVKQVGGNLSNISASFQWNIFRFIPEIEEFTIATSPAIINFTLSGEIAPGERINLHPMFLDDLGQHIPSALKATLDSAGGVTITNPFVSDDGYIVIRGVQGTEFNLTLQTQNTRHISTTKNGVVGNCPLGFVWENDVCVCSTSTAHQQVGISSCDMNQFKAFLQVGYWLGCTDTGTVVTGYCPLGYCKYENITLWHVQVPRSCKRLQQNFCIKHRRGDLCGMCEEGYTAYYHSDNICGKCTYGAAGVSIYIFAELFPLAILFIFLMVMKLNMASGYIQSFLLFAQTTTLINRAMLLESLSEAGHTLIRIHAFIFGFLNMDFFRIDEMSFCLWSNATMLDNLLVQYSTTVFAIILLGSLLLAIKYGHKIKSLYSFKKPIIHNISTFLILPYTHYTITSFQILSLLPLYGDGGTLLRYVVRLQGNVEYFGKDHLLYAIPAVLVIVFLSIPPPLLLMSYPLLWKIKAKFRHNVSIDNDTTIWLIRKLLPLIDSFQGVFKDNRRMFSGLYLVWRLIIAAIFAFSTNFNIFFLLTSVALF